MVALRKRWQIRELLNFNDVSEMPPQGETDLVPERRYKWTDTTYNE